MAGLFGPTPSDIRAQRQADELDRLRTFGSLPSGTLSGATSGRLFGQAINALGGGGDPELQKAEKAQAIKQRLMQSGLEVGSPEFLSLARDELQAGGFIEEAMRVASQMGGEDPLQRDKLRAEIDLKRAQADKARRPAETPASIALIERAMRDPEFRRVARDMKAGGVTVNLGQVDKPMTVSDSEKFEFADGTQLAPDMTPRQVSEGLRAGEIVRIPPAERKRRERKGTLAADMELLNDEVALARDELANAEREWILAGTPKTELDPTVRNLNNAIERLTRATAGRINPKGEPSNDVARAVTPEPGAIVRSIQRFFGGGTPESSAGDLSNRSDEDLLRMIGGNN